MHFGRGGQKNTENRVCPGLDLPLNPPLLFLHRAKEKQEKLLLAGTYPMGYKRIYTPKIVMHCILYTAEGHFSY